jgi:hypothetical protein
MVKLFAENVAVPDTVSVPAPELDNCEVFVLVGLNKKLPPTLTVAAPVVVSHMRELPLTSRLPDMLVVVKEPVDLKINRPVPAPAVVASI